MKPRGRSLSRFSPRPNRVQRVTIDVSVMVQRQDSSEPILDATVDLVFTPPPLSAVKPIGGLCGLPGIVPLGQASGESITQICIPATRKQASNKLLYAAPIRFGAPGNWKLEAIVKCGSDSAKISCSILVVPAPSRLIVLLPYLALPPLTALLFAANQCLRKQSFGKDSPGKLLGTDS